MKLKLICALILGLAAASCGEQEEPVFESIFDVPPGFQIEEAAAAEAVGSLVQLTFDVKGRPIVAQERGAPTLLLDADGDGVYEAQKAVSEEVSNCQGLWAEATTLYCVGDDTEGKAGLHALTDTDGDDIADQMETLVYFTGPMGEHGPHDVRRGPDGQPTILLGNHTFIPAEQLTENAPLENYTEGQLLSRYMDARGHAVGRMAPGGALFRIDRENRMFTILLGGFRNPYNHAYNRAGEVFTFDSDMEWDINLPWYREVRSVHAVPGGDYGWRTGSGKFPAYFLDNLPPVDDLGRGSPVGVDFYHHYAYPADYFDSFIQGDWSRGRIVLSKFQHAGATYETAEEPFDFVYGEPLNVTDLEVGPDGFVYFTMGGRDTAGGFYRVAYKGVRPNWEALPKEGVLTAVRQPQPLSAWGHAQLLEKQQAMGEAWGTELRELALDGGAETDDRVQAVHLLQRFGPKPNAELLGALLDDGDPAVRAASIYVVGQHGSDRAKALAVRGLGDEDPLVQRRAAEALIRMGLTPEDSDFAPLDDVYALLDSEDRFVRWAGRLALERIPRERWKDRAAAETSLRAAPEGMLALVRTAQTPIELEPVLEKSVSMLRKSGLDAMDELRLLRALHVACIKVEESFGETAGCRDDLRRQMYAIVAPRFPSDDERLNREYARTLAYSQQPGAIPELLAVLPEGDEDQPLQIHYAYCLRALKEGWTADQKQELLAWFQKAKDWRGGASFPGFINRMFDSSLEFFSEEEKQAAYVAIPEYAPIDDPAVLARLRRRDDYVPARVFARQQGVSGVSEQEIFEFMMYDPMTMKAKPEEGAAIFQDQCAKCHRFGEIGKDYGPDLTTLNNRFKRRDMVEATLWPSKTISDQYEAYRVQLGYDVLLGLIQTQDSDSVTLMLPEEERPLELDRSKITDLRLAEKSIMPDGLLDGYSMNQIAALFAYLERGPQPEQPDNKQERASE